MNISAMLAIAAAVWGMLCPFTVMTNKVDVQPGYVGNGYVVAFASLSQYPGSNPFACTITVVTPHMATLAPHDQQNVITHEYGHCLGLEHLDGHPGIMAPLEGFEFSGWDRLEFWHHHPAPYRLGMPGVAADSHVVTPPVAQAAPVPIPHEAPKTPHE